VETPTYSRPATWAPSRGLFVCRRGRARRAAPYGKKDFAGFGLGIGINLFGVQFQPSIGRRTTKLTRLDGSCSFFSRGVSKGPVSLTALDGGVAGFIYTPLGNITKEIFSWKGFVLKETELWNTDSVTKEKSCN
jgi:hypothetical protein